MKKCSSCKHETGLLKCNAKHIRWKDAWLKIVSVENCPDWRMKNGSKSGGCPYSESMGIAGIGEPDNIGSPV
jgi:hypothetical protein